MKESAYINNNTNLLQKIEGAYVIFLHDFFDCPHIYPDMLFDDFWQWICATIEILSKADIRFYLKPHPIQDHMGDRVLEQLKLKYPATEFLDPKVSNKYLAENGMLCGVSAYGSIAHELAFFGIPTVCCARHPHHSFNFCLTANSFEQYEQYLTLPLSNFENIDLKEEALKFIWMHNLYGSKENHLTRDAYIKLRMLTYYGYGNKTEIVRSIDEIRNSVFFDNFITELISDDK